MPTENQWLLWLVFSAVAAGVFLAVGAVSVRFRRQPIERLRLIQWTMLACLLTPLVNQLPGLPQWSFVWPTALQQPIEHAERAVASISNSRPVRRDEQVSAHSTPASIPAEERPIEQPVEMPPKMVESVDRLLAASAPLQIDVNPTGKSSTSNPIPAMPSAERPLFPTPSPSWPWLRIVLMAYAAGVAIMCGWYVIGYLALVWLNRTARAVPDHVAELFRSAVADPAALKVRLGMHRRVELPLAFGLWRPTILLPEQMCLGEVLSPSPLAGEGRGEGDALRYSLIHEWSHLARGDVWRWRLSTIVGIVFFYQPLFWWLRRQLRLCQDYLADSHAALSPSPSTGEGQGEGASNSTAREDYAQFLVSLAHRRLGLPGTLALSVGDGRSNLYRRVQMLLENRQPLVQHLRWPRRLAIAVAAIALIGLASAIRLTADESQPAPEPAAQARADAATPAAQPAKQATANAAPQPMPNPTPQGSDKPTPTAAKPDEFTYTGTVQEKDPSTLTEGMSGEERRDLNRFNARQQQEQLPGKPIAGARVHLQFFDVDDSIPPKRTPGKQVDLQSNANGKFTFTAPAGKVNQGLLGFAIEASHPGFIPRGRSGFPNMLRPPDAPVTGIGALVRPLEIDMLPAKSISGVVVSPEGKPVAGVGLYGYSRPSTWQNGFCYDSATSDEHGRFELPMTATGDGVLWLQPAKDFIPMREDVGNKRGDLGTITLQPGTTLKGQLLNAEGAPRPGVEMWAERRDYKRPENAIDNGARFQQYVTTYAQGDFVFAPLPPGEYRVDLAWTGEQQDLRSRYVPQTITLVAGQEPAPLEFRERFNPDVTVRITGHIEISKNMLEDIARMRALVRTSNSQRFAGLGTQSAMRPSTEVESAEKVLQLFAPAIRGTNNGVTARAKGEIDAEGNFIIHVPRGLQQAVIELASAPTIIGLTRTGGSSRSQRNTNDEQVRFFQPQWRLDKDKPWTTGSEIVVGDVGSGIDGIEAKYPETDKLHQFTTVGTVQDESTGQPIAGARIVASLSNGGGHTQLGEVVTDAAGKFAVAIPVGAIMNGRVDQPAFTQGMFGLTLDVKHPEFASPRTPGDMLQLSISPVPELRLMSTGSRGSNGEGPVALQPIYMRHGQLVTGALHLPDGKPAAGISILASTLTPIGERLRSSRYNRINADGDKQHYGWEKTITDDAGQFRFVLPSEGDAILAIWPAKIYAPIIKEIHEQRGDLGIVKLEPGDAIKGRVVDVQNKPLAGIYVNAEPIGSDDKRGTVRTGRSIDYVNRAAVTDANGDFEMAPLEPGEYRVELRDSATDLTTEGLQEAPAQRKPLPDLFVPQKVTLVAGQRPAPMVFRPPETVVVEGQVRFKRSNPASGIVANSFAQYKPKVVGTVNGLEFSAATSIDADGKFTAKVPKGATDVQVELPNREGPQIRAGKDKPLVDPGAISLGTVNEDVHGVEIVYP